MSLESGVTSYIHCQAVVDVFFPVDDKGVAYCRCNQCYFHSESTNRCRLNNEICEFPNKYVGGHCPLKIVEEGD